MPFKLVSWAGCVLGLFPVDVSLLTLDVSVLVCFLRLDGLATYFFQVLAQTFKEALYNYMFSSLSYGSLPG